MVLYRGGVMIKKIFSFDFEENIKERDKFDGVLSVIVFLYSLLAIYLCAKVIMNWQPYGDFVSKFENPYLGTLISNIPIAIVQVFPIFIILLARKQKLSSIGFKLKGSLWQILLGIVFTIPISHT